MMTIEELGKDTQQQQETPFEVVLVDIEMAVGYMIHCVKKPLEEPNLKFVALSYRWGELHETLINTKVGYTASVTSFNLYDFYQLCYMMTYERDMKHIKYVWVDAICVDQRPSKRKATIYQMSNIYERATYILAVPDLHMSYLRRVSIENNDILCDSYKYSQDIYHLIQGNTDQLAHLEEKLLDTWKVPEEPPELRPLLLQYTGHFADGFMTHQSHRGKDCPVLDLDHIGNTERIHHRDWKTWIKGNKSSSSEEEEEVHWCNNVNCPLRLFDQDRITRSYGERQLLGSQWKSEVVKRSNSIRQSMHFLTDLFKDWSSRVWVISEFNIAKKKNNLKYWFIQLTPDRHRWFDHNLVNKEALTFFTFDFKDDSFSDAIVNTDHTSIENGSLFTKKGSINPVYIRFHSTAIRQLRQQTFLEMMLSSFASRNEDRFYSILPLSPYQDQKREVSRWKISSMLSVKLKLYEMMNTKDKVMLFFWSNHERAFQSNVLPTFATSILPLISQVGYRLNQIDDHFWNFDLTDNATLILHHHHHHRKAESDDDDDDDDVTNQYYLRLKPKEYILMHKPHPLYSTLMNYKEDQVLFELLGMQEDASIFDLDIVFLPAIQHKGPVSYDPTSGNQRDVVTLVGSLATNEWVILPKYSGYHPERTSGQLMVCNDGDEDNKSAIAYFDIY
ncbi:unnamed protein product [Absidia cylindrospora]